MKTIQVCAAVIRKNGRILLCTRPAGKHLEGKWEFPGGKVNKAETDTECLRREIREELGVDIMTLDMIFSLEHEYPGKKVSLRFYRCVLKNKAQKPEPQEGQQMQWLELEKLLLCDLLPADVEFAKFLNISKFKAINLKP